MILRNDIYQIKLCDAKQLDDVINFVEKYDYVLPQPISSVISVKTYLNKLFNLGLILIIQINGEIGGIACGYANDKDTFFSYLQLLLVSPYFQGKGFGQKLIQGFIDEGIKSGMNKLILTCDRCNERALRFYKKMGLEKSDIEHKNNDKIYLIKTLVNE